MVKQNKPRTNKIMRKIAKWINAIANYRESRWSCYGCGNGCGSSPISTSGCGGGNPCG